MDINNNLILVKSKDKTVEIEVCKYEDEKWFIKYQSNNKIYSYNYSNISWYKEPRVLDHEKNIIFILNTPVTGIIKILDFGDYIKIIFKTGFNKIIPRSDIVIEESSLSNKRVSNTFDYLKELANDISVKVENENSFLNKQFNNIKHVSPRSVLSTYLEGKELNTHEGSVKAIFPFGFNISQKSATEKALNNQVSVIEGPPGTGKTQTILNIIANAIIHDKTVAVVSNNNSATANIIEKLERYDVDFIAAYLGNKDNKTRFFNKQKASYPNMSGWGMQVSEYETLTEQLGSSQKILNEMLTHRNKQASLKQELSRIQTEYEYFNKYYNENKLNTIPIRSLLKFNSDKILNFLVEYTKKFNKGKISTIDKLYILVHYGIYEFKLYKYPTEDVVTFLQKIFYENKINELDVQIKELSIILQDYNFDHEMKEYSKCSMDLFKAKLAKKYSGERRIIFGGDALWKNFDTFNKEYPVILSTTHSLRSCAEKNYLFDYLIVDEASQVDIVTGSLALSCAKNAVIVGDTKQLPHVIPSEVEITAKKIFDAFGMGNSYNYSKQSLLSSFLSIYKDIPKTLLKEHYRCHPKIIGFCNQKFYNNELIIYTDETEKDKPIVLYKSAKGNHARGKVNQRQIDIVINEILPNQLKNEINQTVGLISPYRLQANELQKVAGSFNIEADTVHKFQGREKDIIILTTVKNEIAANDFVDNPNLINVAVSRAVNQLVVVVSDGVEEKQGTNIGDLVRYIKYNNFEIIESKIYSVFDLLYSQYSEKLLSISKKHKKVSVYQSENLMNIVISKVLNDRVFQNLDWVLHQPLRMLIKDPKNLTSDERNYAMNILTHTDFLIYNKIDKMPVLVIEVDGHAYHTNNPIALKRDIMKNEILKKFDIPILRLKTTESREEERLRLKLLGILGLDMPDLSTVVG